MLYSMTICVCACATALAAQDSLVSRLASKLDRQLEEVPYLRVVAQCRVVGVDEAGGTRRIAECSLTVVRSLVPAGKMYVHADPDILQAERGGFFSQNCEVSYDGRVGMYLRRAAGTEGGMAAWNTGWIGPERPKELLVFETYCGWAYTAHGVLTSGGRTLLAALLDYESGEEMSDRGGVDVAIEGDSLVVKATSAVSEGELWFDQHGALTNWVERVGGIVVRDVQVGAFHRVRGILPYPAEIVDRRYDSEGRLESTYRIEVSEAALQHDPSFAIDFPQGAALDDRLAGRLNTVGWSEREIKEVITNDARVLREAQRSDADPLSPSTSVGRAWVFWIGALFVSAVLLGLVLRRRGARRQATAFACLCALCCVASGQDGVPGIDPVHRYLPNERLYNCGVLASGVVAEYFGCGLTIGELASRLGVDGSWYRAASLERIGRVFEDVGLEVSAFEGMDCLGLQHNLQGRERVAILHLNHDDGRMHYVIAVSGARGGVYVLDAGRRGVWIQPGRPDHDRFLAKWSGYALVLERKPAVAADSVLSPTVAYELPGLGTVQVDVGDIDRTRSAFTHRLPVRNMSRASLRIENVQSSCSCVEDAFFDGAASLGSGESGELCLVIRPSVLGVGDIRKTATLILRGEGGARSLTQIGIVGRVVDKGLRQSAFVVPRKFQLGVVDRGVDVEDVVSVIVPNGVMVDASVDGALVLELLDVSPYNVAFEGEVHTYLVRAKADSGRLSSAIVFSLKGGDVELLRVPFTAEWR